MAINIKTPKPHELLNALKRLIDEGKIVTWRYDTEGDFTHKTDQWDSKAWFRPSVYEGRLVMNILGNTKVTTSWALYGLYHGRFVEPMLVHCHDLITSIEATPFPTNADAITKAA